MTQSMQTQALKLAILAMKSERDPEDVVSIAERFFRFLEVDPSAERVNALKYAVEFMEGISYPDPDEITGIAERFVQFLAPRETPDPAPAAVAEIPVVLPPSQKPFAEFAQHLRVHHPYDGRASFDLYPYQARIGQTVEDEQYTLICKSRQMGITTVMAALAIYYALRTPNQRVFLVTYRRANAEQWLRDVRQFADQVLAAENITLVRATRDTLEFSNGSKIVSQEARVEPFGGTSPTHVFIDELAYIPIGISYDFWTGMLPMVEENEAKVVVASTPQTISLFQRLWESDELPYARIHLPYTLFPGRDEEWAEITKSRIGEQKFKIEFLAEFADEIDLEAHRQALMEALQANLRPQM